MTKETREALLKVSELREKINQEQAKAEPDAAALEALRGDSLKAEKELREALTAEADDADDDPVATAEQREKRELRSKTRLHRFLSAAINGRAVNGAELEFSQAEGCDGLVPLSLFGEQRQREQRDVTPAPADADVNKTTAAIVPAIFDRSIAPWLGVEMPTVPTGLAAYPVVSTSVTGGMKAESAVAAETAGAFTVTDSDPRRLTGSFRIRREDVAKLAGLEEALRQNLSMVLSSELDDQILNGDGTAPNLNGILAQLTDPEAPAASAETFARFAAALASHIDGLYATTPGEVRALVGAHTLRRMAGTFASNDDSMSAYQHALTNFGGVRATKRIADPDPSIQQAVIRRGNPAGDLVAVAPVWSGLELIRDPYSGAGKGEIVLTGISLVGGVVLLRSGCFAQDSFRLS